MPPLFFLLLQAWSRWMRVQPELPGDQPAKHYNAQAKQVKLHCQGGPGNTFLYHYHPLHSGSCQTAQELGDRCEHHLHFPVHVLPVQFHHSPVLWTDGCAQKAQVLPFNVLLLLHVLYQGYRVLHCRGRQSLSLLQILLCRWYRGRGSCHSTRTDGHLQSRRWSHEWSQVGWSWDTYY